MSECLRCGKPETAHHKWTKAAIARTRKASFDHPVKVWTTGVPVTVRAPVASLNIGRWAGHDFIRRNRVWR